MKTPWVVISSVSQEAVCLRCDGRRKVPLPMSLNSFISWCNGFQREHAGCKPPVRMGVVRDENGEPIAAVFSAEKEDGGEA